MTYEQSLRLDFIDWRLAKCGEVQRADISRAFNGSTSQASIDLNEFLRLYPNAMTYDKTAKRYVPAGKSYVAQRNMDNPNIRRAISLLAAEGHPLGWKD